MPGSAVCGMARAMQSEEGMKVGLYLRNMGPQLTGALIAEAARASEEAGIDDLWVADHLALAPEECRGRMGATSSRWRRSPFSRGLPNAWAWP